MTGNGDTDEAVPQAADQPRHAVRTFFLVLLVVLVLGAAGVALGLVDTANAKSPVPSLVGMTTDAASKVLSAAQLNDGRARYFVTADFPEGRVLAQTPAPGTLASRDTSVDVQIAIAPQQVSAPDLVFSDVAIAKGAVGDLMMTPSVRYAYSKTVATGLVVEQLPRPGQPAFTGSPLVLVVSLGPGSGGQRVPGVVGKLLTPARSLLASQTLFAEVRAVQANGVASGTVVDQAPSAGSIVPATSIVTLSVSLSK